MWLKPFALLGLFIVEKRPNYQNHWQILEKCLNTRVLSQIRLKWKIIDMGGFWLKLALSYKWDKYFFFHSVMDLQGLSKSLNSWWKVIVSLRSLARLPLTKMNFYKTQWSRSKVAKVLQEWPRIQSFPGHYWILWQLLGLLRTVLYCQILCKTKYSVFKGVTGVQSVQIKWL